MLQIEPEAVPGVHGDKRISGASVDASNRDQTEESPREIAGRIFNLFDDERRSIARELHDTTAQNLAALSMNLAMLSSAPGDRQRNIEIITECNMLTERCLEEVRALSYRLHPPLLNELGLLSALQSFIEFYGRQTGVEVELHAGPCPRLSPAVELAAFRIAQEALVNVHRHSGDKRAAVTVEFGGERLDVTVRDWGKGVPAGIVLGNSGGIAGMRERVRSLGGSLEIRAAGPGTCVRARIPVEDEYR